MKRTITILSATTAILLGTCAYAADNSGAAEGSIEYKKNGGYEANTSSHATTANGTYKGSKTDVDVDVDSNGNTSKEVKTKATIDPKGMMNKKTYSSDAKVKEKSNGGYKKTVKEKSTDASGTNYTTKSTTDVDVDSKGNVTKTNDSESSADPKGMMNNTTTKSSSKTVNGQVIEEDKTTK